MKFADQRAQYAAAQEALIASEKAIKAIRRQLTVHIKEKTPAIEACLPPKKNHFAILIKPSSESCGGRTGAAYRAFGIRVVGLISWHVPDAQQQKAIKAVMAVDGWVAATAHFQLSDTHWWIDFT